jgi:predicted phosphodiesterase
MTGINWIHLSDWHQRGNDFDRRVIKEKLLEDIERRATINPNLENIDFVVFSGDLTYNGRKEEFETIKKELLDPLLKACGDLDPSRLFIVPGNHDLNRDDFELLPSALLHHLTDADAKCWLNDERKRAEVLKPFYEFANFISAYTKQKNAIFGSVCELNLDGNRIALIGLNSALMCGRKDQNGDDDDERNILVGEPQIQDIFNRISGSDIKIAVLHHPFDWLARFDRRYVEERLTNECDFILNGHQHHPVVKQISKTVPGYYVHISTGAAYDNRIPKDPLYINAYNLVHLDLTAKQGVVFLRHWNNSLTEWTEDRDSLPDAKFQFSLAKLISNSLLSTSEQHGIAVSLEAESDLESFQIQGPPIEQRNYMDSLTFVRDFDHRTLDEFRIQIREEIRERYPDNLSNVEFLTGSNLMVDGHLTRSGVLFIRIPRCLHRGWSRNRLNLRSMYFLK